MGRRNAMEIQLTGTEVHELREVLESLLPGIEKEIASTKDPESLKELQRRRDALRSIEEKLPVGLIETS
jgi:hypothetical protein